VSEIMLQQTQVATVQAYFQRFMAALPTIQALARAEERQVLRLWEGLGYYRRARHLHQAARILVEQHGGEFPRDAKTVRGLPGIGRYTAGAVLAIAFDVREPILEANTKRLFSRLLAYRGNPGSATTSRLLWTFAEAVLPRRGVGTFNQALMELGGQVCAVRDPLCDRCPVALLCKAHREGLETEIPAAGTRHPLTDRHEVAVVIRRRGRVLLVRCPEGGRWAGLWDFPRFQVRSTQRAALDQEICRGVEAQTGTIIQPGDHLTTIKHGVTRFRITLDCYGARYLSGPDGQTSLPEMRWLWPSQLAKYPLSTTGRKLSRLAAERSEAR
jgi:A/G-specific adenine glycosylase